MLNIGFETRIKITDIVESQLPEFITSENPKTTEFLKQYYIGQEYQGGPIDIVDNLDQYLKLDNLTPEVIVGNTSLAENISSSATTINVSSTKGFPKKYGLIKIDDEVITYTGITTNSFTGCIRGFSGITDYTKNASLSELIFTESESQSHLQSSEVNNLSVLFLQEFYKKTKYSLNPGLESVNFTPNLNIGNFIKESRTLYRSKGTDESFRILFNVLFNDEPKIIDLENFLIKSSTASYARRKIAIAESVSGNPLNLEGQLITKTTDSQITAAISEVEAITRNNKTYYKLFIFVGYDDSLSSITGNIDITGSTKNLNYISPGSSAITVDSTIGFPEFGKLYSGSNVVTYTKKTINQFLGCSGVVSGISTASAIYSEDTYYGYENGDLSKKVEIKLVGVISDFNSDTQISTSSEGEYISVKNIGEKIEDPDSNQTLKEVFANIWNYNTNPRYQINKVNGTNRIVLKTPIDKILKVSDRIDILLQDSEQIVYNNLIVNNIISGIEQEIEVNSENNSAITLNLNSSIDYEIRKKIRFGSINSNTKSSLEYPNIFADIQNVYNDSDEYMYVASNSIPSYEINVPIFSYDSIGLSELVSNQSENAEFANIVFANAVSFITGDLIYYKPSANPIGGLQEGNYYIEVLASKTEIRLYISNLLLGSSNYVKFNNYTSGTHNFTLLNQKSKTLSPQKILRKFPLSPTNQTDDSNATEVGYIGMLSNGVEILNYKSENKIYYGPLEKVNVLSGGVGYDVSNPPLLEVDSGNALVQPIVRGSVEKVYTDPQDFDIDVVISASMSGGNGSGASFEPVIEKRNRKLNFNARSILDGGGLNSIDETITFEINHGLSDGEVITYDPNSNPELGIGTYSGSNNNSGLTLKKGTDYVAKYINDDTIQLYPSVADYRSGINTVGFTTISNSGIHNFYTLSKNRLIEIKVINGGSGYENRKLRVLPVGISTVNSTVFYKNHGFNDGEVISYEYQTNPIVGLTTINQYYIKKVDDDYYKLCDAGIGGTFRENYEREKYVKFSSSGSGYQIFKYPDITLNVRYRSAGIGSTEFTGSIVSTPVIKGEIIDTYVYEKGSNYGSFILNNHKKPNIIVKNGKGCQLLPIINDGKIIDISILNSGEDYYSTPNLKVIGDGIGAILRPVIENNKITAVVILNSGSGYTQSKTEIIVESSGKDSLFNPQVRSLTVNNNFLYGSEVTKESNYNLQYSICSYSKKITELFNDSNSNQHSPIIGWAYDGNPIYGSYAYEDPNKLLQNTPIKRLESGYILNSNNVISRPPTSQFPSGFFIEDYVYNESGDLDKNNGRFCITPEFPNGTYAYFATTKLDVNRNVVPSFPYFIGDTYKSKFVSENKFLDQTFNFNNSNLIRNTFPYKLFGEYTSNDFVIGSEGIANQISIVDSVESDSIDNFNILNPGRNYKINDAVIFNDVENNSNNSLDVRVSEIVGENIESISSNKTEYSDSVFTWIGDNKIEVNTIPYHEYNDLDYVNISGFSSSLSFLNKTYQIGVSSYKSHLIQAIPSTLSGIVTDIYLSNIPNNVSIEGYIKIGTETLKILNVFDDENAIRVVRSSGVAYTSTTRVDFLSNKFVIENNTEYFDSKVNRIVYFNPNQSIGLGTTSGSGSSNSYKVGNLTKNIFVPTQAIYLPDHKFNTGQKVIISKRISSNSSIGVANTSSQTPFNILSGITTEQRVYVIKKTDDYIGIVTQIGLTTSTNGLFFLNSGSDDYQYSFRSEYNQIFGNIETNNATISVSTSHGLSNGDIIKLSVISNNLTGIGTSSSINVSYDSVYERLVINPIDFTSGSISTITNQITLPNHNLVTGDKIIYDAQVVPTGLSTGIYYVYKIDNNRITLCETIKDSKNNPPKVVDITNAPSSAHQIKVINPSINVVKGDSLVFNLSDPSLSGYKLKIFLDNDFKNQFSLTGLTTTSSVVSTGSSLTIKYDDSIGDFLYYCLEKSGSIIAPDSEVTNYSRINFVNSVYTDTYNIVSTGNTTFKINLRKNPERNQYNQSNTRVLEYTTTSESAKGGISKIKTISSKSNFKKLPIFDSTDSVDGNDAYILPVSDSIGKIKKVNLLSSVYEYSSDKTIRPEASISNLVTIKDAFTISEILILDGGKNYVVEPNLVIVNTETGKKIDSGLITASIRSSSITSVNIIQPPKGIPDSVIEIKAVNNTNGVRILSTSHSSGIVTCTIVTPLNGFTIEPFALGDKIFVEGIQSNGGDGLNSENYGYEFFTITSYLNGGSSIPRVLTFAGVSTNAGIPVNDTGQIINYNNYPKFSLVKTISNFIQNENLEVSDDGSIFTAEDLKIIESNKSYVKISGLYRLKIGNLIRGVQSGTIATVNKIDNSFGYFNIGSFYDSLSEWKDDIGKLSQDNQVIPDNDYYQNLSYSIKSRQTWDNIVSPVNSILHPVGLKNFSDTEIINSASVGVLTTKTKEEYTTVVNKLVSENRVDTINDFDLVIDTEVFNNNSELLKFKNKKLASFIELRTNRVLRIDDISDKFNIIDESDGYELKYQNIPIFMKTFDPNDSEILNLSTGVFKIQNHFFNTGEELIYRPNVTSGSLGIGTTSNNVGIPTNILPSTVYAIRIDNESFKISTRKDYALASPAIGVTFTSVGIGTLHELEMYKSTEKSIITINDVVQSPISYSLLSYSVNTPSGIGSTSSVFALSGIGSISPYDILKIDNEYMNVLNVGLGTTSFGPITFSGPFSLVEVERGFVGSSASTHSNSSNVYLHKGSFRISKNKIYFTDSLQTTLDNEAFFTNSGIEPYISDFTGRVFLRKDYTTNNIFDDISPKFTGIGQTYRITVGGANTSGVGSTGGNGLIFINGIFQTPRTPNNNAESNTNYSISDDTNAGITSVVFNGIRLETGSLFISENDVNMNELPRGGVIVSLGSTAGLGYAPLVGASVTAVIGAGGSITSILGYSGSGYRSPVSVAVTESGHSGTAASVSASVGLGGTLSFTVVNGGTGYTNPIISVPSPTYSNLSVIGVSRLGVGNTTECGTGLLLDLEVRPSSNVGIGSTLYEVSNFKIVRNGYGFRKGDVIKVVGLVTDANLANPVSEFKLEILESFNDSFSGWQFGYIDYMDSIKNYQDGVRTRFPLFYNGELLSFQKNDQNSESQLIDIDAVLIVFINGILQQPGIAYEFSGGTTFTFTSPPRKEDEISLFVYRGSYEDSFIVDVDETIKVGDEVQSISNNNYLGITTSQTNRLVREIYSADTIRTNTYFLDGIDPINYKPVSWSKQKVDKNIEGVLVYKSRNSIESQIYPTARIVKDFSSSDNVIYTDNAEFFNYERDQLGSSNVEFDAIIFSGSLNFVSAAVTAIVANNTTIQSLSINDPGSGYEGSEVIVNISNPSIVGSAITASASISIVNGSLSTVTIINPGFGYSISDPPQVIIPSPQVNYELIKGIPSLSGVNGASGYITGIQTSVGIGTNLALRFTLESPGSLSVGDIIFVFDTKVGNGVTSIVSNNSTTIGVGTEFLNNIYYVNAFNPISGIATCNIRSDSNIIGISTSGSTVGKYSWGKLSGFTRSNSPISIAVSGYSVDVGLSTFPIIQRRGIGGLRRTGSLNI
jgi:hypothetical protein